MTHADTSRPLPLPRPSIETEPFWAAVQERRLTVPKCNTCETMTFPPTAACMSCGGDKYTWTPVSGRGKVYSFTVYHRVYNPAFKDKVPYAVAVIELAEGPRMISGITGMPTSEIVCEMPVEVVFEEVRDGFLIPRFRKK